MKNAAFILLLSIMAVSAFTLNKKSKTMSKSKTFVLVHGGHPDHAIASNRLTDLTDYFETIVNTLPDQPIMIGHSLGGLVAQLLLHRGLGAAAVAIHSFPPSGVSCPKFSFVKAVWEAMALFTAATDSYLVTFKKWKYSIANGMSYELQKELYYRFAIPESKIIVRDAFKCIEKINFKNLRSPLLFTSGNEDRIIPSSLNYNNYKKYKTSSSLTDYREFKKHNHLVFGQPAWVEEADFILYWLEGISI